MIEFRQLNRIFHKGLTEEPKTVLLENNTLSDTQCYLRKLIDFEEQPEPILAYIEAVNDWMIVTRKGIAWETVDGGVSYFPMSKIKDFNIDIAVKKSGKNTSLSKSFAGIILTDTSGAQHLVNSETGNAMHATWKILCRLLDDARRDLQERNT